ncbi:hypothetical protein ACYSNR_12355 [Enterococcus sp. LJL128]|uniref:hypothetical protein n=1 Tax=Enterococcus sp. LJL51 TaxID=3416656 RepID=UPI003CF47E20
MKEKQKLSIIKKVILVCVTTSLIGGAGYFIYSRMNTHNFNGLEEFQQEGLKEGVNNIYLDDDEDFDDLPNEIKDALE